MNGVQLQLGGDDVFSKDELNRLADWDQSAKELMRSTNPFIQELACLHGLQDTPRFNSLLDSAFDSDEALAFDAINQLNESDSGFSY